jgi:hypothetical protein
LLSQIGCCASLPLTSPTKRCTQQIFRDDCCYTLRTIETTLQHQRSRLNHLTSDLNSRMRRVLCGGAGSWYRKTPRAWPMAQQSSREFATANPTKGEEDARVQERGIHAKISLNPRSHLQHIQRPTPSYLSKNTPKPSGRRPCRRGVKSLPQRDLSCRTRRTCIQISTT